MTALYRCEICTTTTPASEADGWLEVKRIGPQFIYDEETAKDRPTYIGSVPAKATGDQFCSMRCLEIYAAGRV